jgi:hypothetical protein
MRVFFLLIVAVMIAGAHRESIAQSSRAGMHIYYLLNNKNKTEGQVNNTNQTFLHDNATQTAGDIYYQWFLDSSKFMRTSVGYGMRKYSWISDDLYSNGNRYHSESTSSVNDYLLKLGLGKSVLINSFKISAGAMLVGAVSPDQKERRYSTNYNVASNFQETFTRYPDTYSIGAQIFLGIDYTICKKLNIGLECGVGANYRMQKGYSVGVIDQYSQGTLITSESFTSKISNRTVGWGSVPIHINLSYNL